MILKRTLENKLRENASQYPIVLLTGPRQSGKTTLCQTVFKHKPYISFENPDTRAFAQQDPRGLLENYPEGAIFDEIQKVPEILSYIQGIVDSKKINGMYILTGSQNFTLLSHVQQSLAGRVALLKLLPFTQQEMPAQFQKQNLEDVLYQGFFPRIFDQKLNPTEAMRNYVETYVQKDVREILNIKNVSTFHSFLKVCAGRVGQLINLSSLGNDLGVSHTTIREWLSILEASYIIYTLPPYYRNFNKRILKSPKIYFTDVGLACYLLGIEKPDQVSRDPLLGGIFENLVIMDIVKHYWSLGKDAPLYFFRDNVGNEVDLIIEKTRRLIGVEIKAGRTVVSDWFKGLNYLNKLKNCEVIAQYILYGGFESHTRSKTQIYSFKETHLMFDEIMKDNDSTMA